MYELGIEPVFGVKMTEVRAIIIARMSKKAKPHKLTKTRPRRWPHLKHFLSRIPKLGKIVLFALGIPGLYLGLVSVLPRISIASGEPLDTKQPATFPLFISNDGYLDVDDAKMDCLLDRLSADNGVNLLGNRLHTPYQFEIGDLAMGGHTTTICGVNAIGFGAGRKFEGGHMTIVLSFRPAFSFWHITRQYFFTGMPTEQGQLRWFESSK
jgi:hypothetical protein